MIDLPNVHNVLIHLLDVIIFGVISYYFRLYFFISCIIYISGSYFNLRKTKNTFLCALPGSSLSLLSVVGFSLRSFIETDILPIEFL